MNTVDLRVFPIVKSIIFLSKLNFETKLYFRRCVSSDYSVYQTKNKAHRTIKS